MITECMFFEGVQGSQSWQCECSCRWVLLTAVVLCPFCWVPFQHCSDFSTLFRTQEWLGCMWRILWSVSCHSTPRCFRPSSRLLPA